jgi:spermidine synthase
MNEAIFYGIIFVSGFLTGGEFPLAGRVLLSCEMKLGKSAGIVNSADHLGATFGAFITGIVLVPVLGIVQACLVLAIMKFFSLALFLLYKTNLET